MGNLSSSQTFLCRILQLLIVAYYYSALLKLALKAAIFDYCVAVFQFLPLNEFPIFATNSAPEVFGTDFQNKGS